MTNQLKDVTGTNNSTALQPQNESEINLLTPETNEATEHVQQYLKVAASLSSAIEKFSFLNSEYPCQHHFKELMIGLSENELWDNAEIRIPQVEFIEEMRDICNQLALISEIVVSNHILIIKAGQSLMAAEMEAIEQLKNLPEFNN